MNFLNKTLGLDASFKPYMIVVVGHSDEAYVLPDIKRKVVGEIMREY